MLHRGLRRATVDRMLATMSDVSEPARIRVAIVGCGDVAHRWYLPALASLRGAVEIVAFCDGGSGKAERATAGAQSSRRSRSRARSMSLSASVSDEAIGFSE